MADGTAPREAERWRRRTGGNVKSSPTVIGVPRGDGPGAGTVFVGAGSHNDDVFALAAADGATRWRFETEGVWSSPAVTDGSGAAPTGPDPVDPEEATVFAGSWEGYVYALSAADASPRWAYETGTEVTASPTVHGGTLYVGDWDGVVHAVDAASGAREWTYATDRRVDSSPSVVEVPDPPGSGSGATDRDGPATVFVGSDDGTLYALDAGDGTERWTVETGDRIKSSPTVARVAGDGSADGADGASAGTGGGAGTDTPTVFVGSTDYRVYAVDAAEGTERWRFETGDEVLSSPTVRDGTVYVGSNDGGLYAVDAADGTERWSFGTGGPVRSSPTVAGGAVFVGSDDGNVYAVDAAEGAERWRYGTGDDVYSSPTVVEGTLYVGSYDGGIYALETDTGATSAGSRARLRTLGHHDRPVPVAGDGQRDEKREAASGPARAGGEDGEDDGRLAGLGRRIRGLFGRLRPGSGSDPE